MGWRQQRPQPWGPHQDLVGAMVTMWGWWGWCRDDGNDTGMMGTMGTTWGGDNWDHSHGDHMGTLWELWGWCGDDVGITETMRGWRWPHGDNEITKNAITFERIEIIEFHLKIWDPGTLLHTYRLDLMCRWGVSYPKCHFYAKRAPVTLQ